MCQFQQIVSARLLNARSSRCKISGPPSLLIVVQPGMEVNAVVKAAATKADRGNTQLIEERDADAEVLGRLRFGEAADHRTR